MKAFCSSISGALAARAMFESIGVGDENATAYGATLTWLIKGLNLHVFFRQKIDLINDCSLSDYMGNSIYHFNSYLLFLSTNELL